VELHPAMQSELPSLLRYRPKSKTAGEMDTAEGKNFIRDLAEFKVPVILFSGGEPLLRQDLLELARFASEQGIRLALSTNGTLITRTSPGNYIILDC